MWKLHFNLRNYAISSSDVNYGNRITWTPCWNPAKVEKGLHDPGKKIVSIQKTTYSPWSLNYFGHFFHSPKNSLYFSSSLCANHEVIFPEQVIITLRHKTTNVVILHVMPLTMQYRCFHATSKNMVWLSAHHCFHLKFNSRLINWCFPSLSYVSMKRHTHLTSILHFASWKLGGSAELRKNQPLLMREIMTM